MNRSTGFLRLPPVIRRLLVAVIVIALIIVPAIALSSSQAESRSNLEVRFQTRGTLAARFAQSYVSDVFSREERLARTYLAGATVSQSKFQEILDMFGFDAGVLLDRHGRLSMILPSRPSLLGKNMTIKYKHLRAAVGGRRAVSGVVPSAARGIPLAAFAIPYDTPYGRRVLCGGFNVSRTPLGSYLRNSLPQAGATAYVVDSTGNIITSNLGSNRRVVSLGRVNASLMSAVARGQQGSYSLRGVDSYFVARPIPGTSWRLIISSPEDSLYAPVSGRNLWVPWALYFAGIGGILYALWLLVTLTRSRARLAQQAVLLDLTHSAVFVKDATTSEIRFWNPAAATLYGWTAQEAIGRVSHKLLHTRFPQSLDMVNEELERSGHWEGDLIHTTRDGRTVVVDSRWALQRDANGRPIAVLEINSNITERKRAEAALDRSHRQLEAKTREQEAFIYTVSHDLRAPLLSLQGLVAILSEDYGRDLNADAQHYLQRISFNAGKMQDLLTELLELAKIGRIETELAPVDLERVVSDVVQQLRTTLDARNAQVLFDTPLPTVTGNPVRLCQLFTNLLDNAVHYTPADRVPQITIRTVDRPDTWEIVVADNGAGIPLASQDKVFGLFQRLPAGKTLNPGGSGAGLAIVARVVETHGGSLWLESTEGSGTAFHFTLQKPETTSQEVQVEAAGVEFEAA